MNEPYSEAVTWHAGPESYADDGNIMGAATATCAAVHLFNVLNQCRNRAVYVDP